MLRTPSGGAGNGTAAAGGRLMSIGAVVGTLRHEFPEVTISKIRFLEAEGLVEPQRTPSGYRKFAVADVERLAQVLRMQRDHYLPLKVIKEHLDAAEQDGDTPAAGSDGTIHGAAHGTPAAPTAPDLLQEASEPGPPLRIRRADLLEATGAQDAELGQWESYGLIEADSEGGYDADAVQIGKLIRELGGFGLEPRHLRAVKAAADRDAGLVEQVVAPLRRHRNPQTRAHAEATARELAALSVRLHAALVHSALRLRHG
jgi:DNA-binding transcriptional MerR regulator